MGNVKAKALKKISPFRKIAIGTWQTEYDPSIYGSLNLRMDASMDYIEQFRQKTGKKLTVTHLVIKAVAMALAECPEANAILRFNRIYIRENIDVAVLVVMEDEGRMDLSSSKLENVDQMSLEDIVDNLEAHVAKIRAGKDKDLESTRQSMKLIPALFINRFLKIISFLTYTLNINLSFLGMPKDAFGGAIVTSIGSLGLDIGYVPLVPYSRVPIFVAPGVVRDEAVVENGKVIPGKVMGLHATIDHRVIDGAHAAKLTRTIRKIFADPFASFGPC